MVVDVWIFWILELIFYFLHYPYYSQVSVRVRDKGDHSVMSMENLLSYFKSEIAAFH